MSQVLVRGRNWTTPRLALTVVLGAINGVIGIPMGMLWSIFNNAFGVIGASLFQAFGIFIAMAAFLIPAPGVFLLCSMVGGLAGMLLGSANGVLDLYWGLAGGLAGEIAGLIFGWDPKKRVAIVILAGILYIPATNIVSYFAYGWGPGILLWIGLLLSFIAFTVESSLLGILLGKWLAKTGLLRTVGTVGGEGG